MQSTVRTQQVNAGTRLGSCSRPACGRPLRASSRRHVRVVVRAEGGGSKAGTQKLKLGVPKEGTGVGGLFGTLQRTLGSITQSKPSAAKSGAKDARTVFVAGATGRTGVRIVRELLDAGFKVRAGARNVESAEANAEIAVKLGLLSQDDLKRLSFQEFDLTDAEGMAGAIGNASKVVCAVGAAETSFDPGAPKRIDGDGTTALIQEASKAGVEQFVLVSSLGTGKVGFPAAVLNLFWGVLLFKRQAEVELEQSGMSYTIVRPGGMERPTDTYKRTHNLVLKPRDSIFGGQVSRLQVAELVSATLVNPGLSENKVLEVVAEETAPVMSFEQLLQGIPSDISRSQQLAANEELEAIRAELAEFEAAVAKAQQALELESEKVSKLQAAVQGAKANEKEVKTEATGVLKEGKAAKVQLEKAEAAVERAQREEVAAKAVLEAAKKAGQAGELLSKKELAAVAQSVLNPPKQKEQAPAAAAALPLAGLFGGSRSATPAPQKQEEEVLVEEAKPAGLFGGFFSRSTSPAPQQVQEEEEEEEEVVEEAPKPAGLFGGIFGSRPTSPAPVQVEEEEEEVVVEEKEEEEVKPAGGLFGGLFGGSRPVSPAAAPVTAEAAPAVVPKVEKAEPKAAEPEPEQKPAGGLFGGLFGGAQTMQVGEDTKINVPSAAPEEEAPKPRPAAAAAPAAPAQAPAATPAPAAPRAPAPPPFDAAEAKRKAVLEEAKAALEREQAAAAERQKALEEEERIKQSALAAAAEERAKVQEAARKKKEAEEKARADAEVKAKAEAAAKAKAEAEARAMAEEEVRAKFAAEQAKREAEAARAAEAEAEKQATAAPAAAPAAAPKAEEEVPANVAEARAWIANWKKKQGKATTSGSSSSSSSSGSSKASSSSGAGSNGVPPAQPKEDVAPNVAEAREWIAQWKAKQAGGGAAGDGEGGDGEAVVEEPPFANMLNKFFGGFGNKE